MFYDVFRDLIPVVMVLFTLKKNMFDDFIGCEGIHIFPSGCWPPGGQVSMVKLVADPCRIQFKEQEHIIKFQLKGHSKSGRGLAEVKYLTSKKSKKWDEELLNHVAVCQNLVPLVNIKIAGKWMVIPLKMVLIGIDP